MGIWLDSKCTWKKHVQYIKSKCEQRINFIRSITGSWWGAHPEDLIRLYKTTVRSVIEYGSFCFYPAARTHILVLKRIQYRCLRLALGSMNSTHTKSLEVLAGVPPLMIRFYELGSRFLIRSEIMNPIIIANFEKLLQLMVQSRRMPLYYWHMSEDISPAIIDSEQLNMSFLQLNNDKVTYDISMKQEINNIPDYLRSKIIPLLFSSKYGRLCSDKCFHTDGSSIDNSVGYGVFNENVSIYHQLKNPCSVFVAELAAIYNALIIILNLSVGSYYIFSDSLSSIEALKSIKPQNATYFIIEIRKLLNTLTMRSFSITFIWIPSHCLINGNEKADILAKKGAIVGEIFERKIDFREFFQTCRRKAIAEWQRSWDEGSIGRYLYGIAPKISKKS